MKYDVLAFIGRFQPFHMGHKSVVDKALTLSAKVAIVLGGDQQPRSARNPFTTQERIEMISSVYPQEVQEGRISFVPQVDHTYNMDRWIAGVQKGVQAVANTPFTPCSLNIGLIGHSKDASSFYLKSFPSWDNIEVESYKGLDATTIRANFFCSYAAFCNEENIVPKTVGNWLLDWMIPDDNCLGLSDDWLAVNSEMEFIDDYKKQWAFAPYPPVFYTADAVVVQSGHILLVKRGAMPGKGLWALPGGFVNRYETSRDAAVRELKEETRIALPEPVLRGSIRMWNTFEDPYRSQRGRTITTAYLFSLSPSEKLPKIKGSDDAEKAQWVPISHLKRDVMYEDHYDICERMVNL